MKLKKQAVYQELWGAEHIQSERLDPGIVHAQLPVDPRAFDAGEDAQVGGEPCRVWEKQGERQSGALSEDEGERAHEGERRKGWCTVPGWKNHVCSMSTNSEVSLCDAGSKCKSGLKDWRTEALGAAHSDQAEV